jgi:hypothetical protein
MAVVKLRAATRADLQRFYPGSEKVLPTMNALVGLVDGRIVGIGGVTRVAGKRTAFCDVAPEGRCYKLAIARAAKRIMADEAVRAAAGSGRRIIHATINPEETGAERWLMSLGFRPLPNKKGKYQWQA